MPMIRIEYSYKEYPNCPKATFVSKYTNHPVGLLIIGAMMFFVLLMVRLFFQWLANITGLMLFEGIGAIFAPLSLISFLAGPLLVRWLANRNDWAKKIAISEGYVPPTPENSWVCRCGSIHPRTKDRCYLCGMSQPPYRKIDTTP